MEDYMDQRLMYLKILLPYEVFAERHDVKRLVVDTVAGSYGFLPNRLDCTVGLTPGILTYETETAGEVFVAVDEGVMVKTGKDVYVSVRHAFSGADLGKLHLLVSQEFLTRSERDLNVRSVLAKLESGFVRRFISLKGD